MSSVASICCAEAEKEKHQLINTFSLQHPCSPGDFPFKRSAQEARGDADTRGMAAGQALLHHLRHRARMTLLHRQQIEKIKIKCISGKSRAKMEKGSPSPASLARADPRQDFQEKAQRHWRSFNCKRNGRSQPKKITGRDGEGGQGA